MDEMDGMDEVDRADEVDRTEIEPLALMYHGLDPGDGRTAGCDPAAAAYTLPAAAFQAHLAALEKAGRRIMEWTEWTKWTHPSYSSNLPHPSHSSHSTFASSSSEVLLTFDDGALSDYDVAFPLLREGGLRACFFITTSEVGAKNRVSWEQLREMAAAGMTLGSHGHTHRFFSRMSPGEQRREMETSRRVLEDQTGATTHLLSLPGGRFDRRTFAAARDSGYRAVFTSSPTPPFEQDGVLVAGRVPIRSNWTAARMEDFLRNQPARLRSLRRADTLRRLAQRCLGDALYAPLHRFLWSLSREIEKSSEKRNRAQ